MAAKIAFLLALLFCPSIINAQLHGTFSVELKLEKTNYAFGEEVKPVIKIKNISGKKDSLTPNQLEDVRTANNLQIFQNSRKIRCEEIYSSFVTNHNKIFEPGEVLKAELELNYFCGSIYLGKFGASNFLDTGFYTCYTYLRKDIKPPGKTAIYEKIKSNEIFFRVHPPNSTELEEFTELKEIFNYSQPQFKDTIYMTSVLEKLDNFTRKNVHSNFSDMAFYNSTNLSGFFRIYTERELSLADFYLQNKPNGLQVSKALYFIWFIEYLKNSSMQDGLNKLEEYATQYPNTIIETEAKRIIAEKIKQTEKERIYKTKKAR